MITNLKRILQIRGVKLILEIMLFIAIFSALKMYMQRDLISGTPPLLEGTLLNGQTVNLQSYQGRPLLLHFWATWCKVCKLEEDSISDISESHQVLTIAMQSGNGMEIESYLKEHKLSFPVLVDEDGAISNRFRVKGVPTSFILDSNGEIQYTEVGYTTGWGLRYRLWMAQE